MSVLLLLFFVIEAVTLFLAIVIYFLVKKLASQSQYAKHCAWASVIIFYTAKFWYILPKLNVQPQPSDEYMIKHFQEHRADLEALVKAYREEHLIINPRVSWDATEHIKEIKRKTDVSRLHSHSSILWFENPYSNNAEDYFSHKIKRESINVFRNHSYNEVVVELNNSTSHSVIEQKTVVKSYLHIPQVPKIEDGELLNPVGSTGPGNMLVMNSLDKYPYDWERTECFVKPLDLQWFILLCWLM